MANIATPTASPCSIIGKGADFVSGFLPQPTEYNGDKGHITAGLDSFYNSASNIVSSIPVAGEILGTGMRTISTFNKIGKALGGGTDGLTTTDAILGSDLVNATGVGMVLNAINGFGGKKADTMAVDTDTFAKVGASYGASQNDIIDASRYSGKKFGSFSSGARRAANARMAAAGRTQNLLGDLALQQDIDKQISANQTDIAGSQYENQINGGYNQMSMRAAKSGMKLFSKEQLERTSIILSKKQKGGTIEVTPFIFDLSPLHDKVEAFQQEENLKNKTNTFDKFKQYLKENGNRDSEEDYDLKSFYESKDTFEEGKTPYELWLKTESKNPGHGYLLGLFKKPNHITYEGPNGSYWKENNGVWEYTVPESHRKLYTFDEYKKYWDKNEPKSILIYGDQTYKVDNNLKSYKEGGSIIPEGSLHARKHHLEDIKPELAGQITSKGVPVVIEKEGGEVEQQAEIELNEIIFRKEITEKIEEACKEYYKDGTSKGKRDELAISIGKLIATEIMENTDDKTGLIDKIE